MPLLIYKKFSISGLSDQFLEGSLTKKQKSQNFFYTYDPFKKGLAAPEIENFPLMPLLIYNKKLNPSHFEQQRGFWDLVVKSDPGWGCPAHRGDPRPKNVLGGQSYP